MSIIYDFVEKHQSLFSQESNWIKEPLKNYLPTIDDDTAVVR